MHAISEILLVCFFWSELIVTDLYPLGHHDNILFIPKQHAHKESDFPGAVSIACPLIYYIARWFSLSWLFTTCMPLFDGVFFLCKHMHAYQIVIFNNHASLFPTHAPLYCWQNQGFFNKLNISPVECSYITKSRYYLHITWKHCQRKTSVGLYWITTKLKSSREQTELFWLRI